MTAGNWNNCRNKWKCNSSDNNYNGINKNDILIAIIISSNNHDNNDINVHVSDIE